MAMGLQDLVMFRDNLQQPEMTGIDNLRNLQALTRQDMFDRDMPYDQQAMMMNTGLATLPVVQMPIGGLVKLAKKATSIPRKIVKGVGRVAKGLSKNKIARIAIPLAAAYFGGPAFAKFLATKGFTGATALGAGAGIYGGTTGLMSLAAGDDLDEAVKKGVISGGTYYLGGKLLGGGSQPDTASGALTPDKTGFAGSAPTTGSYSQVGQAQLAQGGLQPQYAVGAEGALGTPGAGATGIKTASAPQMSSYFQDIGTAQYPGGGIGGGSTPVVQDQVLTDRTLLKRVTDSLPGSGVDEAGTLLTREVPGLDKLTGLIPESNLGKAALGVGALSLLGGPQPVQQFTPDQLSSAGITTDFDGQRVVYRNADGEEIDYQTALQMIQQASQDFGPGGQRRASGVRLGFERVNPQEGSQPVGSIEELRDVAMDSLRKRFSKSGGMVDPVLSASGGVIGMMYGGMPANNMDVRYREFSGMVGGQGGGMEDNVYMPIVERENGQQVATLAVSPKEYVVDANTMSLLGNGNPDEGAEIMDETVKDIRMAATGQKKQQKEIDGLAALDRMRRSV